MPIRFDKREVPAGASGKLGGAIFTLAGPAGADAEFRTADGERVSVGEESRGVLVSEIEARDPVAAWRKGLVAAQRGLDIFSARGIVDLRLSEPQLDHLLVYGERGSQILRVVGVSTAGFRGKATGQAFDASGRPRPPTPPVSAWHESMRYYRRAQLSEEVFDSFRNLWLAFENLLDSVEPKRGAESERAWLKRALGRVEGTVGLEEFLPTGTAGNLVDAAYAHFYDEVRNHLFHAKASRRPLLPDEQRGTNLLVERHRRLTRLYLGLLEQATGVRRGSGRLAKAGFDAMMRVLEVEPLIEVTDDRAPEDPDAAAINPAGGVVVRARAAREEALELPFLRVFLARLGAEEIAPLQRIRKVGFSSGGNLVSWLGVEGELEISDLGRLEVQMGMHIRNAGLPRSFAEM